MNAGYLLGVEVGRRLGGVRWITTIADILTIVGDAADEERDILTSADRQAAKFQKSNTGVLFSEDGKQYDAFYSIAQSAGASLEEAETALTAFPKQDGSGRHLDAGMTAADLYAPQLRAAYYFGLAMGLREHSEAILDVENSPIQIIRR
jgi:hypothetical protein